MVIRVSRGVLLLQGTLVSVNLSSTGSDSVPPEVRLSLGEQITHHLVWFPAVGLIWKAGQVGGGGPGKLDENGAWRSGTPVSSKTIHFSADWGL